MTKKPPGSPGCASNRAGSSFEKMGGRILDPSGWVSVQPLPCFLTDGFSYELKTLVENLNASMVTDRIL